MKPIYYVFLLLFTTPFLYGQQTRLFQFFNGINEVKSLTSFTRLDSLLAGFTDTTYDIKISGYADFLGSTTGNILLSQQRADALRERLLKSVGSEKVNISLCKGFGERDTKDKDLKLGDPANRRVEVEVILPSVEKKQVIAKALKPPLKKTLTPPKVITGLQNLKKGESMAIEDLSFIPGRHIWLPSSAEALANLLYTLQQNPSLKIEIQGHICCISAEGDALDFDTNERALSTNRARAVYNYLVKNGIDAGRLQYKGYARTQPKVQEERTSADEQTNRRVEILILDL